MEHYLEQFKTYMQEQDYAKNTVNSYCASVHTFLKWHQQTNGEVGLQKISGMDIREYREYLGRVKRAKAKTINFKLSSLQCFFGWAANQAIVDENPVAHVKQIKETDPGPRYLTKAQQKSLLRAIDTDLQLAEMRYSKRKITRMRDACMMRFLLNTGLRVNELTSLDLADITLTERKGQVLVRNGKGNKQRIVPLNKPAREAIQDWLAVRPEGEGDALWVTVEYQRSKPLGSRSVQYLVKRLGEAAGIPELTPHVLRHSFAKNLVDKQQNMAAVAELLGHANLNTTRFYVLPNLQDLEKSVDELEEEFDQDL
jgi:site-specific recombinase XerD